MNKTKTGARRLAISGRCLALMTGMSALAGCVQIETPDKPIEINLNVNIRQEVVYSLKQDANDLIKDNPELFPK